MTRRIKIWIVVCFALSISVVCMLFVVSKDMRQQPGSFLRAFPPHPAIEGEVLNLKYNSYYIAGGTGHHLYLGNYTAPLHLLVVNQTLTDTQHIKLTVKGIAEQKFWAARVKVDSPYYYLTDGTVPAIYRGNVHDWKAERYPHDNAYFQDIVPLSNESFFIRSLGKPERENILGKITTKPPHLLVKKGILQKQIDGIFCTDGMMDYNKSMDKLIYLYRYRNEYIVMDTNLQILRRSHTIDTTTQAKIQVASVKSGRFSTLSSPPRIINKQSDTWQNLLFVHSPQLARNETPLSHNTASAIDVYSLLTDEYMFSFYLYDYQSGSKLRQFRIYGSRLFALFDEQLQVWHLRPRYFRVAPDL